MRVEDLAVRYKLKGLGMDPEKVHHSGTSLILVGLDYYRILQGGHFIVVFKTKLARWADGGENDWGQRGLPREQ